jgi:uncharacterized damage-inducible protein DinB
MVILSRRLSARRAGGTEGDRMNASDLHLLIDYHYWARDRVLDAAEALTSEQFTRDMGSSFRSVRDTLVHIYAAEWAWHSRWRGASPTALVSPELFPDIPSLRRAWADLESQVRALLSPLDDHGLNQVIEYKLLSGQPGASILWQMAQHVVNHASYHRGQVVTLMRQLGVEPAKGMDLIAFYRQRATSPSA